jgi:hypothetical protein
LKKEGGEREGLREIKERVNLVKVHGMHLWNFHNEIPLYL